VLSFTVLSFTGCMCNWNCTCAISNCDNYVLNNFHCHVEMIHVLLICKPYSYGCCRLMYCPSTICRPHSVCQTILPNHVAKPFCPSFLNFNTDIISLGFQGLVYVKGLECVEVSLQRWVARFRTVVD